MAKDNSHFIPDFKYLKINKPGNECPCCKGLGETPMIDLASIIDQEKSISEKPFSIWRTGTFSGFYHNLLLAFCELECIDTTVPFRELPKVQKNKILSGKTSSRIPLKFKYKGVTRQRRAYYEGVMLSAQSFIGKKTLENSTVRVVCSDCLGSRINLGVYRNIQILEFYFIEFLTLPLSDLFDKLNGFPNAGDLVRIIKSICDVGLGYLSFSRSIPSLSGGELQKLRFSRLLNSNISGVLLVIDEISSQINENDFPKIFIKLKKLSKNNTIVLVEHSSYFIDNANYKIHIGLTAGYNGGYICPDEEISPVKKQIKKRRATNFYNFQDVTKNNVVQQEFKIPKGCLTIFTGLSGSGKSSIARVIEEREGAIYISQKRTNFNSRSVLASSIKINNLVATYFSKNTGVDSDHFLLSKEAGCKTCDGIGVLKYERGYDKDFYLSCPDCEGELFNRDSEFTDLEVNGLTIIDFYNKTITELHDLLYEIYTPFSKILETMVALGLGHLQMKRKTQTLSGGELRRIKLCEHLSRQKRSNKILIIDEPVAGLDPETASNVANFIYQKVPLFSAVILIEHRKEVIDFSDYEIKIGPLVGKLGGKVVSQKFL